MIRDNLPVASRGTMRKIGPRPTADRNNNPLTTLSVSRITKQIIRIQYDLY